METKKIIFFDGKKKYSLQVKECFSIDKGIGLMFSRRNKTKALLFDFHKEVNLSLHSFFVFYPFLVMWLDDKNRIIEKRIVNPFELTIKPKCNFFKVIEIPINKFYSKVVKQFTDGKQKV